METEVKLTKLASCAGCGAKVGAGTLVKLLDGFRTHSDPRLLVGYDKSDDASVYYLDEHTALVQTTDFFPPIVDDPFLYGQIAAANAISDVYAMGGEPKLASCAGCGAKVGAGTLVKLLDGFRTHSDPRLLVGYDKSDDASVYYLDEHTALVQTTDFFPPIVDDPFLYGQIAAANAISDVYAMGGEPKLALNILCLPESMTQDMVQELLRGGYDKAYEAGAIITGGHTIHGAEPIYGLAVSGFVDPRRILTNSGARPGDVLLLTKPLGVGVLTTAAKAGLAEPAVMDRIYRQMAALNRTARDIMVKYRVHSCTDVTGFALLGHGFEMAQGSGCTVHIQSGNVPFHPEAWDLAAMGLIPAGAYRNRDYAEKGVTVRGNVSRTMQDLLYDPQTSGGLLMAVDPADAEACLRELRDAIPAASQVGYVTERQDNWLILE